MKKIILLLVTLATALSLAACGSSSSSAGNHTETTQLPSNSHNAADVSFSQMMISHHSQAIDMASMAATRASNPEVKALAVRIKAAQGPEITQMTGWLKSWGQPTAMAGMGHAMGTGMMSDADMKKLDTLSGAAFDREFLTMMTTHHKGAIDMARTEQSDGSYSPAKSLASNIISAQSKEISEMATLLEQV